VWAFTNPGMRTAEPQSTVSDSGFAARPLHEATCDMLPAAELSTAAFSRRTPGSARTYLALWTVLTINFTRPHRRSREGDGPPIRHVRARKRGGRQFCRIPHCPPGDQTNIGSPLPSFNNSVLRRGRGQRRSTKRLPRVRATVYNLLLGLGAASEVKYIWGCGSAFAGS